MTILPVKIKKTLTKDRDRPGPSSSSSCSGERQRSSLSSRKSKKSHVDMPGGATVGMPPHKKSALRSRSQSPGVNSDDERRNVGVRNDQLEAEFAEGLRNTRGWQIKEMGGDGACMFRAVADQVYGDEEMHGEVRRLCMNYMERNRDHFSPFITEDFEEYVARKRESATHGNHVELQAISEMYGRPVEVYEYSENPINIFNPSNSEGVNAPLRLSYHRSVHYNSVVDPLSPTIGVGLGLPGHVPGAADAQLIADAVRQSDAHYLEEAMLNDKMHMTDWQRTEEDLKDQVARESYLEYVKRLENEAKSRRSPSRKDTRSPPKMVEAEQPSGSCVSSPLKSTDQPCSSKQSGLYEELLAAGASTDWSELGTQDEDAIMAQALLLSQQQFMEDLQKKQDKPGSSQH